jgi:tetratricopeptide (TPR) repeat protein
LFAFHSILPPHEVIPKARQAAERAIHLSPSRIEPYSVLAYITAFYDWNWAEAKKQFEKTFAVNPDYAVAHYWYCNYLTWVEKNYGLAIQHARKAIELEPLLAHSYTTLASVYVCSGKFEEARKLSETAIELDTDSFLSYCSLSMALHALGKYEEAIKSIKLAANISRGHQYTLFILSWLYATVDNKTEAEQIFDELVARSKTEFISGLSLTVAAYYANKHDEAFEFLEQAFNEKSSLLISINGYPFFSFIKTDSKFQPFLQRMNYPA